MTSHQLRENLRQMLAVLQAERQALAGLDIDGIMGAAVDKRALCGRLDTTGAMDVDEECRGLLDAAELDELLSERDKLNERLQEIIDRHTDPWGIKISMVEVKNGLRPATWNQHVNEGAPLRAKKGVH